jgi:hypothetical protein
MMTPITIALDTFRPVKSFQKPATYGAGQPSGQFNDHGIPKG